MVDAGASNKGDFGYGQQDPTVQNDDFNATAFLVRQMVSRLSTMKLVKVVKVTPGEGDGDVKKAGTVDVQPLVSQIDGNGNATPHGVVYGVPWSRAQGGKNAVVVDPEAGDIGYVVCADRDISAVKAAGKESPPGSRRQYDLADGVYCGACLNVAPEQYLAFTADGYRLVDKHGNSITSSADGINLKPAAGKPVTVDGPLVVNQLLTAKNGMQIDGGIAGVGGGTYGSNIRTTGTVTGDSDVVAAGKSLKAHTHPVTTAPGTTGANN